MKKHLFALGLSALSATPAWSQSTVTIFGTIDLSARYVKNDGSERRLSMGQDGLNSSQLAFSGREDLGSGSWAGFTLNHGFSAEIGAAASPTQFWNRRSTVSVGGSWGEIRLGRDYTPVYLTTAYFDPFGAVGVGSDFSIYQLVNASSVRASNAISYLTPGTLGGVYGQFTVAASEAASANPGRLFTGKLGYASGQFDVVIAGESQRFDSLPGAPTLKVYNVGGKYDFQVVRIMGWYEHDALSYAGVDNRERRFEVGAVVPLGQAEIQASFNQSKLTDIAGQSNTVSKWALGYVYNLSKRTALYSTASRQKNGSLSRLSVISNATALPGMQTAPPVLGGKSIGLEAGLRHFF